MGRRDTRASALHYVQTGRPDIRAGRAGCPGFGSVDELDELCVERSNPRKNSGDFVDGNWGKDGEC